MLNTFKFKPVDPSIVNHTVERRGFVKAPFDYKNSTPDQIDVFYRLIPALGSTVDDHSKPMVVVMNGGPGFPSSVYRPLDFDYADAASPKNGILNRFHYLSTAYRILLVDQRGTDGQTAPLDMDDPNLNPDQIAKYFSSDSQARDYLAVIEQLIPKGEEFFVIAQSYGGMVGMQYLSLSHLRKPQGMVFSSAALPYANTREGMLNRREEQFNLNLQLLNAVPDIAEKLHEVRSHFEKVGIQADRINALFSWLGRGETGVWENALVDYLKSLLALGKEEIELELKKNAAEFHSLNYILSSANFTPGQTDRTIAFQTSKMIVYEPWMLDEDWIMIHGMNDGSSKGKWVKKMDESPPPPTSFMKLDKLKSVIGQNQLLFTAASNDAFVPLEGYVKVVSKFQVEGHTELATIPGGHNAIFLEKGFEVFSAWANGLKTKVSTPQ